ncbi:L-seryl-tRNA(Sec) selenium transferase [Geotalea sp. SG265]|uniref:L-seryl-tRNA(Sec) selenium transferase n=1 Tax=Geotalea sp. SG265 TaxID=2922867 RepID=UPI001FAF8798|nr:L-seryl-tRNA(Sec) selenium transferase [Geotalea sp. SG265]
MNLLKQIPKVDKVLGWEGIQTLLENHPRPVVIRAVRTALENLRNRALRQEGERAQFTEEAILEQIGREIGSLSARKLKRLVNGTGVVIHTNLGRSPLPERIREALDEVAFGYSNLEFDLASGERGSRYAHVEEILCELTGAEAALVVNNNAAAVLLALSSLAAGREVIVSRGELVEIGGSFRIPDVMRQSGAILREVGATNRTHPGDYSAAVTQDTGLLLKVHCSNFAVVGFTAEVSAEQLVELGKQHALPVLADVGSGNLVELSRRLGCNEPTVQEFVDAGVDVITFSGDKLLGGPQAGIIIGRKALLAPMKKHPLLRAVRIDKLTLAALEGTLQLYRDERQALQEIPTLRMLTVPLEELADKAKRIAAELQKVVRGNVQLSLVEGFSQVGGGALPLLQLPTVLIAIAAGTMSAQEIEQTMRLSPVPVIGRIFKGAFLLDPRTILEEDIPALTAALQGMNP